MLYIYLKFVKTTESKKTGLRSLFCYWICNVWWIGHTDHSNYLFFDCKVSGTIPWKAPQGLQSACRRKLISFAHSIECRVEQAI